MDYMEKTYYVRKKSGNLEDWDSDKIIAAIRKSAERVLYTLSDQEEAEVIALVEQIRDRQSENIMPVAAVHNAVEKALSEVVPEVGQSYREYRNWVKKVASIMEEGYSDALSTLYLGDPGVVSGSQNKDNANADTTLASTKSSKIRDWWTGKILENRFMTPEERKAHEEGYIYIHDRNLRYVMPNNCCLFDVGTVLSGGFEMGNVWYNEPKSVDTAFDVVGDITMMGASQQYGGFTIPRVDAILAPYAQKSYDAYYEEYLELGVSPAKAAETARAKVIRDIEQGFQGWEYKFNTVASSRGDYPFITITFGLEKSEWGKEISKAALKVRMNGQGKKGHKKPVLFPKLVFLYDENLHGKGKELEDVFEAAISCSARTMYPDYLSLTGEGYVPEMYKKYGSVISPMGCRAFLSPWYERGGMTPADDEDKPVFEGRFNIGVVSLNLPMILAKSRRSGKDFYEELDYYLEMIRRFHIRTYDFLGNMRASSNPLGFCEGGFYGGHLNLDDKIAPVLKSSTASFGITALNELQRLYNGKSIAEDGEFALEVMKHINGKLGEFKKEDGILYAIYGTPAESLCSRQVEQFRKEFGIVTNVSDRLYVSNSFHCHVTEDISPIQKQDLENRFWNEFNGGKIQYVRYPLGYNTEAIRTLVRRAMKMGFYEGVNISLSYCDDCGHEEPEMDVCPCCGSKNLTKIDRMNGYLAYSRVHGDTRLNKGKMAEIADRKSM